MAEVDDRIELAHKVLRTTLGATAFLAGADKFFNRMTDLEKYLAPQVERRSPVSGRNFMRGVGVVEMLAGAGILSGRDDVTGYVAAGWLMGIVGNLVIRRDYWDVAARDLGLAASMFALGQIARVRREEITEEEIVEGHLHGAA